MPRLIDRLLAAKGWQIRTHGLPPEMFPPDVIHAHGDECFHLLRAATVFVIDNVARYYFDHHVHRKGDLGRVDGPEIFPQLAPPFPCTFYEYNLDPANYDALFTDATHGGQRRVNQVGVLVLSYDAAELHKSTDNKSIRALLDQHDGGAPAKWLLWCTLFDGHTQDRDGLGPRLVQSIAVNADGSAASCLHRQLWGLRDGYESDDEVHARLEHMWPFVGLISPAFLATSFLHCRNVDTEDHAPTAKLNKAYLRRHGQPLVRYRTLTIEPMKQVLRNEGRIGSQGLAKALHICRGHFKDYRTSAGLFGKHKGLFWWDMHARGAIDQGAVVKDYAIKLPNSEAVDPPQVRS